MNSDQSIPLNALNKATVGVLLFAFLPLPYSYYMFLRWAVMLSACAHLYIGARHKRWITVAICAAIGVLFNPLAPVYLTKGIWFFLDIGAAALLALCYADLQKAPAKPAPSAQP